jgi:hypothetical protein
MAKPLVIYTDGINVDFNISTSPRLTVLLEKYYEGSVFVNPNTKIDNAIEIQICEHIGSAKEIHEINFRKDIPIVFHHTEGDLNYVPNYKQLENIGTFLHSSRGLDIGTYCYYWAFDYRNRVDFYNIELNSKNSLAEKFLCFNGRPDIHRWFVLQNLADKKLLKHAYISFLNRYNEMSNRYNFEKFLSLYGGKADLAKFIFNTRKEIVIDRDTESIKKDDRSHSPHLYENTSVSLITETYADERPGCFITEKSWKAIANCHLPIWVAQKGIVENFRQMGFDVFDDVIDHRYDLISTPKERWAAAVDSLKKYLSIVSSLDSNDINQRLLTNQQKYLNMSFTQEMIESWL